MIALAYSNPSPPPAESQKRQGYNNGYRKGTFDKCNGNPARNLDGIANTKYNRGYIKGYLDGYCSNDSEF